MLAYELISLTLEFLRLSMKPSWLILVQWRLTFEPGKFS
jgi:hypothetical protein